MFKNIVESTFQRASVAADYDELTVSVGKLRMQLNDLRHVVRDLHQELDRTRAELAELRGLRAEIEALKRGGLVVAPAAAPAPSVVTPMEVAAPVQAPAPQAPAQQAQAPAEPAAVEAPVVEAPAAVEAPAEVGTPVTLQSIAAAVAQAAQSGPPPAPELDSVIRTAPDGSLYWGPLDNPSARARASGKTLIIDQLECISCGTCVEQTDAVFVLPDDSKAVARKQEGPMDAIQDAIDACPVTCIHWTDNPGQFPPLNDEAGRKLAS